ncbi:MAG: S41 family peptidase [Saprospiraceae bacterium]
MDTYKKWQPFLLGLCAAIGLFAGMNMRQAQQPNSNAKEQANIPHNNVQKITDVLSYIQSKYVDSLDMEVSTDVALESLLACLDPYSEYIPVNRIPFYTAQISGKQRNFGLDLLPIDSQIVITQIEKTSPAFKAGIETGDYLLSINNQDVSPLRYNFDSLLNAIENEIVDTLKISCLLRKENIIKEINFPLQEFDDHPVSNVHIPVAGVLYLKLKQVSKASYREFMNVLETHISTKKCKHLILDLRGNTGGLVHEAASILNQLIQEKELLLFKTSSSKTKDKEYKSTGKPFFILDKIIVLIDHKTASAAELIAASLQDLDRAIIIGQTSYGKSTVLEQFSLADGSAIRLAVSRYITASGRCIQKQYEALSSNYYVASPNWNLDTNFYSLKKRKLPSGKGVVPDLFVASEKDTVSDLIQDYANRIVVSNIIEFRNLIQSDPEKLENDTKVKLLIESEIAKLKLVIKLPFQDIKLFEVCKLTLAEWVFGTALKERMLLLNDKNLEVAIKKILE